MSEASQQLKSDVFWPTYRLLVLDQRLSSGSFRLWHYLHNRRDKKNQCWPTQRQIAGDIGCKAHSLKEWTCQLESAGYLHVEQIGQRHNNRYTILPGSSIGVVLPEWATRGDAQKGNTAKGSRCPKGHAALPERATPRVAQKGNLSNSQVVNTMSEGKKPPVKLSPTETAKYDGSLKRVNRELEKLGALKDHDEGSKAYNRILELRAARTELLAILDLKA